MRSNGSVVCGNIAAVTMAVGLAYNRCIGTMAESPKKGMRMDGTRIQDPTEMQSPSRLQ